MCFQNINDYYNYLEKDIDIVPLDSNIDRYIKTLRNETDDEETKKTCLYELYFIVMSEEKWINISKYIEWFDYFEYIKIRAKSIQNKKYKALYYHLLWLSPQKHYDFAKQAIENYLSILQDSSFSAENEPQCYAFVNYFENLFELCQTIDYKKIEVIHYFVSILQSNKLNDYAKYLIMDFVVKEGKKIDIQIIQIFYDYSIGKIEYLNSDDLILNKYLCLLVILCQKLNKPANIFHEKLGDYHILKSNTKPKENFTIHDDYMQALKEYQKANNKEKIEEVTVLVEQAKKTMDLKKIPLPIDEYFLNIVNKIISKIIEENNSKGIYEHLAMKNFLPPIELPNIPTTLNHLKGIHLDINKNIQENDFTSIKNQVIFSMINDYINNMFIKGVKSGKISFESLMDYLKNHSWYGKDFTYLDTNSEIQGFNWIELLSPSLQNFFVRFEIDIKNNEYNSHYILEIDSLVLKFEGLLREFSRMIGAQTIELEKNSTKERVGFDKLLDNKKLKRLIPEDNVTFLKFIFTTEGINLRNNIAHCFFKTKSYTFNYMLLLIVALLKLGSAKPI